MKIRAPWSLELECPHRMANLIESPGPIHSCRAYLEEDLLYTGCYGSQTTAYV